VLGKSLHQLRASARAVVDELQEILAVLRDQDGADVTETVPGIESLDALLDAARATGTEVVLQSSVVGEIDHALSVSAYRVVQESLTTARKHENAIEIMMEAQDETLHIRAEAEGDQFVVEARVVLVDDQAMIRAGLRSTHPRGSGTQGHGHPHPDDLRR
jgi:signal transduction histidine kinase